MADERERNDGQPPQDSRVFMRVTLDERTGEILLSGCLDRLVLATGLIETARTMLHAALVERNAAQPPRVLPATVVPRPPQ